MSLQCDNSPVFNGLQTPKLTASADLDWDHFSGKAKLSAPGFTLGTLKAPLGRIHLPQSGNDFNLGPGIGK